MALPSQTKFIVGNEACERFSFYGMTSLLMFYMVDELQLSENTATEVQHLFKACVYLMPILGGWLADKFIGRYNTILYISLFYCIGHGVLAMADLTPSLEIKQYILFAGLAIIALGAGGIKPCVSAFAGDQMKGESEKNVTRMYAAFYWSINFGSFFAFLLIPFISRALGYAWAFGIPGIVMGIATLTFFLGRKRYLHIEPEQPQFLSALLYKLGKGKDAAISKYGVDTISKTAETFKHITLGSFLIIGICFGGYVCHSLASGLGTNFGLSNDGSAILAIISCLLYTILVGLGLLKTAAKTHMQGFAGVTGCMLFDKQKLATYSEAERVAARNLIRVLISFLLIIPFWCLFDQADTTWQIQRRAMIPIEITDTIRIGAQEFASLNSLLVMILIPTLTFCVYPYLKSWGHPLRRMFIGIILASLSYGVVAYLQNLIDGGAQLNIAWQGIPYIILTIAEIFVSTTGLEYAYTAAGKKLKSTVTSFWCLTITLGNIFVVILTSLVQNAAGTSTFLFYGALSLIVGLIFFYATTRKSFKAEAYLD